MKSSNGVHILCTRHIQNNSSDYLKDKVGVSQGERSEIYHIIYGEQGLINSSDIVEFECKSATLLNSYTLLPRFQSYLKSVVFPIS